MNVRERPEVSAAVLDRLHAALLERGWFVASARALGLPDERDVIAALEPSLVPDPRGPGKLHARDVIAYDRTQEGCWALLTECDSIAHGDVDDFSRFKLEDAPQADFGWQGHVPLAIAIGCLIPLEMRRTTGRLSADYFRYSPGTGAAPHQDRFGDLVFIWVLDRSGDGAESFLTTLDGRDVMRGPVRPGQLLVFRDEMFLHGVTPLRSGHRDALIFITLRGD